MDKPSPKALRESVDQCRIDGVNFVELTTDEHEALLAIAEAARRWREAAEQIPGIPLGDASVAAWTKMNEAAMALRAALALVEEWMADKTKPLTKAEWEQMKAGYTLPADDIATLDDRIDATLDALFAEREQHRAALVEVARRALADCAQSYMHSTDLSHAERVVTKYLAEQAGKDSE